MKTITSLSFLFLFSFNTYSQNITNTLGAGGVFTIKDNTNTFFSLNQTDSTINIPGNIILSDVPGSIEGVIYKGSQEFLHNYSPSGSNGFNTFLGIYAGNFRMSGSGDESSYNTGIGHLALTELSTGQNNTAVGDNSLGSNSSGNFNTAVGSLSLNNNTTGNDNTAVGHGALFTNDDGINNVAIGHGSLGANVSGDFNTAVGHSSLNANTGNNNTAVGFYSLNLNTAENNTAEHDNSICQFRESLTGVVN